MTKSPSSTRIALLLTIPKLVLAGIENRPGNVDDAYVMDKGSAYVALGYAYARYPDSTNEKDIPVNAGYGLTESLEVTLDLPYTRTFPTEGPSEEGLGDLAIRPEWAAVAETESIPQISLALTVKFDTATHGVGSGTTDYGAFMNASKRLGKITVNTNIGYNFREEASDSTFVGASLDYKVTDTLSLISEIWAEVPTKADIHQTTEILAGATYDLSDGITLDMGIGTGLSSDDIDVRYTAGVTYSF